MFSSAFLSFQRSSAIWFSKKREYFLLGQLILRRGGNNFQICRPSLSLKLFGIEYQVSVSDLTKLVRSKLLKT